MERQLLGGADREIAARGPGGRPDALVGTRQPARGIQRARPRRTTSAVGSRCVDGRWVLEGPAPAWFRGAQDLLQGTPLAPISAFEVTRMLAAGDADDLEQLLRVEVHPDPAARHDAPAYAVEEDPAACLEDVSDDADVHWEPDGRLGVACEAAGGRTRWYRLVERPSPRARPALRERALALPAAAGGAAPARARPAPLLPLSPKLKRARSLASRRSTTSRRRARARGGRGARPARAERFGRPARHFISAATRTCRRRRGCNRRPRRRPQTARTSLLNVGGREINIAGADGGPALTGRSQTREHRF